MSKPTTPTTSLSLQDELTEFLLYTAPSGEVKVEVLLNNETLWLTQKRMAALFGVQRPAITKHLKNIFESKELDENSVCSILEHTAEDGKTYPTQYYNLDAVISVGYRVNSAQATQFIIWATALICGCLQGLTEAIENLWDKYAVTVKEILTERNQVAGELDGFLKELGYDVHGSASVAGGRKR